MGRVYIRYGRNEKLIKILVEIPRGKDLLGNLGVVCRIILKGILKKLVSRWYSWLRH